MNFKCEKLAVKGYSAAAIEVEVKGLDLESFIKACSPSRIEKILDLIGETEVIDHFELRLKNEDENKHA